MKKTILIGLITGLLVIGLFTGCPVPDKTSNPAVPSVPNNVKAVAQGPNSIVIKWDGQSDATGYRVYRDESSGGNFTNLISGGTPWDGIAYTDTGLEANKDYYYKVSAVNVNVESGKSEFATAKTGPSQGVADVDWTSYNTAGSYVFRARNNTNQRLIAFIRNVRKEYVLGGIDANENEHGFKLETAKTILGNNSADFPVIFITEAQYNANYNNLQALENTPFTRIYGYYNAVGTNELVYDINAGLGGDYTLEVMPSLKWNVEIRLGDVHGATLGYVPSGQLSTIFKVNADFYRLFPVVRQYNAFRNEIISYYPKWESGAMTGSAKSVSRGINAAEPYGAVDIEELLSGLSLSTGSAFILVDNQGTSAVQVFNGLIRQLTSTGSDFVNPGQTRMFQVNMASRENDKYAEFASVSTYKIGSNINNACAIGDVNVFADKIYRIVIQGNDSGFTVKTPLTEEAEMTFN